MPRQHQSLENLKGEIAFRAKLSRQHTTGEMLLPDYFSKDAHDTILFERIETTRQAFRGLQSKGLDFTRFLELGAERGHRSLAIVNSFPVDGIAMDISFEQLHTAAHFSQIFNLPKLPQRVCCDANALPLRNAAVPFVVCYQFLHHFPALTGILAEIERVMSAGGSFFFDEEPMGRLLQLHLYRQKTKEYSHFNLRKGKLIRWLESFISETASDEVEHGVIENHSMRMPEWQQGLSIFDECDVSVRTLRHLRSKVGRRMSLSNLANYLLGGVIYGLCRKKGSSGTLSGSLAGWLACPSCKVRGRNDSRWDHPPVSRVGDFLVCEENGCKYPVVDDIPILIPAALRRELYPQYS